jgi:DNA-binding LacI/PurR family transcriptional regulator
VAKRRFSAEPHIPKYQRIIETLSDEIRTGKYPPGGKLPSEAALGQQFQTSRITVGRALRELTARRMIQRVAGSGSYVQAHRSAAEGLVFGLLIPDLGRAEVFTPICQGIANAPSAAPHVLLWGQAASDGASAGEQALGLCAQYIGKRIDGVFFAPLETGAAAEEANLSILAQLDRARIPVTLLDRDVLPYPRQSRHDLVGIDNRRAALLATEHLLKLGAQRVSFVAQTGGASTIGARIAGFREALLSSGHGWENRLAQGRIIRLATISEANLVPLLGGTRRGDGFVCVNDRTAGCLMRALLALGYRIPRDVRIAGIDDVEYASLLPVPLTTVHQPCREIGEAAMSAMLDRIARPNMLPREIRVECRLVIRESCGARLESERQAVIA